MAEISYSMMAQTGGQSSQLSISSTSAQTGPLGQFSYVVVSPTVDCFFRRGTNPTAVTNGTDQFLFGGMTYRIAGLSGEDRLAFVTTGSGVVYISPNC